MKVHEQFDLLVHPTQPQERDSSSLAVKKYQEIPISLRTHKYDVLFVRDSVD